jgi:hypothetical protein
MMESTSRHAVLYNGFLAYLADDPDEYMCIEDFEPRDLHDIFEIAIARKYTHVWLWSNVGVGIERFNHFDPARYDVLVNKHGKPGQEERIISCTAMRLPKGGQHRFTVIYLENTAWWMEGSQPGPFWGLMPYQLLRALRLLQDTLGIPIAGSPQTVGWKLLKRLHPQWLESPLANLRACHFDRTAARDLIWSRNALAAGYYQKFDRKMSYAAAAKQTDFGTGQLLHTNGEEANEINTQGKKQVKRVGVWRCAVSDPEGVASVIPGKEFSKPGEHWLVGPMINLLRAAEYIVEPLEGYVYTEQHDVFRKWAELLWAARTCFEAGADREADRVVRACYQAVKKIAVSTVGQFASRRLDEAEGDVEKRRPDFKAQIVGRNAEVMWFTIDRIFTLTLSMPVLVYNDALYYYSFDEPNGAKAFPDLLKRTGLGAFEWEGCVKLDEVDVLAYNALRGTAQRLELLNSKGWVR